ncbi:hypothetical protein JTE90_003155 [Oedothorax gibbosus]|uniref:U6 snRNA m(6)A methyltransferase n=1 Tax=Oedothorax gibbosus TaxID=931172 RepID=A0AAV6UBT7_9ARAC|nr:hypothetical protein JTE90_003155 [Oedothorax gibbosus]
MAFNLFMHERNIYKTRPDFKSIAIEYPEFRVFAVPDDKGRIHMDFNNQDALRMLTKILLKKDFNLDVTIPDGFLIPTVPQRLNYLLWVEDLLCLLPKKSDLMSGIDIGTGPCAIFSLLGAKKNDWNFVATETSDEAIHWAEKNIKANNLESSIKIQKVSQQSIFHEVLSKNNSIYDFCLCNPPFFENIDEIKRRSTRAKETLATTAKKEEILSDGGEVTFVKNMIRDSLLYKDRIRLYTSMFGRKKSFVQVMKELQSIKDISYTKTEFCQGNTIRWGIAWTFLDAIDLQKIEQPKPKKKHQKAKPALFHKIPMTDKRFSKVKKLVKWLHNSFTELKILFKVFKCAENYAEMQIATNTNTWSHQRRKRRECLKNKGESKDSQKIVTTLVSDTQTIKSSSDFEISNNSLLDTDRDVNKSKLAANSMTPDCVNSTLLPSSDPSCLQPSNKRKIEDVDSSEGPPSQKIKTENTEDFSVSSQMQNASQKRKQEDEVSPEGKKLQKILDETSDHSQKFQNYSTEDHPNYESIKTSPSVSLQVGSELKKFKREIEDSPESSKSMKIKAENTDCSLEGQANYIEDHMSTKSIKIENVSYDINQSISTSEESNMDKDCENDQKVDAVFDSKSLLFSTLKIRKGENHLLLEMNCSPEANRESMHQIFQFLKNKLAVS